MARRRMIDPEFWLDEKLAKVSPHARLLYIGLWNICDDHHATLPNRPEWIKIQVLPYESVSIPQLLKELSDIKVIVLFTFEGEEYWYLKNFFKYQKVEKPSRSKYPEYTNSRVVVGEESVTSRSKDKLSKEKISEGKEMVKENPIIPSGSVAKSLKEKYPHVFKAVLILFVFFFLSLPVSAKTVEVNYTVSIGSYKPSPTTKPAPDKPLGSVTRRKGSAPQGSTRVKDLVRQVFGDDSKMAIAICSAESGCRPDAVGDGGLTFWKDGVEYGKSYGPFQIRYLPGRPDPSQLLDPEFNVKYAYGMYQTQGWTPWSVFHNKSFLSYL